MSYMLAGTFTGLCEKKIIISAKLHPFKPVEHE